MWGRSVFDNIRRFLQFQLTVNVVALVITFLAAVTRRKAPLNAVMMLWVNLIMDTMGALALGTEAPSTELLSRKPYKRDASLINNVMWRNILIQSFFQIALLAYLLSEKGAADFSIENGTIEHTSMVFNTFVFCQIFNEFNARSIGDDYNVFRGVFQNPIFLGIIVVTVITQYLLISYCGEFVGSVPLSEDVWKKSILLGALSFPVGHLMRFVPVQENLDDYAESNFASQEPINKKASSPFSFSQIVWLASIGLICTQVYQEFGNAWGI